MVKQEIQFVHKPSQIRSATIHLAARRLKKPIVVLCLGASLLLFVRGMNTSETWQLMTPVVIFAAVLCIGILHVLTSPRNFSGVEVRMSIRDDGIHFSGANRSGMVGWAGFKKIYLLNQMWAVFVANSDSVTFIPTDQLDGDTLDFMLAKLRENHVKLDGDKGA